MFQAAPEIFSDAYTDKKVLNFTLVLYGLSPCQVPASIPSNVNDPL